MSAVTNFEPTRLASWTHLTGLFQDKALHFAPFHTIGGLNPPLKRPFRALTRVTMHPAGGRLFFSPIGRSTRLRFVLPANTLQ